MFTVAIIEDEVDAARRLEACLTRYSQDHPERLARVIAPAPTAFALLWLRVITDRLP